MARKRGSVVFLPDWSNGNPYLNSLADALGRQGVSVTITDYPETLFSISSVANDHPEAGVIHIHWLAPLFDRIYLSDNLLKRSLKFWFYYLALVIDVKLTQWRGVKVIWTVHNLVNHESKHRKLEVRFRRLLARLADVLCYHSEEAREAVLLEYELDRSRTMAVTPHACYGDVYGPECLQSRVYRERYGLDESHFVFLFFGNIRRYKGVDQLIRSFSELEGSHLRLLIAGQVKPAGDKDWLVEAASRDPRIFFMPGFVSDEEIGGLIQCADIVVLPFAQTLSSGSVLLAITYGLPLILPDRARVFGVPGDDGAIYFGDGRTLRDALQLAQTEDLADMRRHNSQLTQELTWDRMAGVLVDNYLST